MTRQGRISVTVAVEADLEFVHQVTSHEAAQRLAALRCDVRVSTTAPPPGLEKFFTNTGHGLKCWASR